jgi:Uma2 family endonuclease
MSTGTILTPGPVVVPGANGSPAEPFVDGDILYEVVDNEIRELPPMGASEVGLASYLHEILGPFARRSSLGLAYVEMLFRIGGPRKLQRRPDVSYVSFERWPKGKPVPGTNAWEVVPDLAVEIISPTNGANEIIEKVEDYFICGVRRVWVVYPFVSKVYDYASPTSVTILTRDQTLPGGEVLPGFELPLAELFGEVVPTE